MWDMRGKGQEDKNVNKGKIRYRRRDEARRKEDIEQRT
jgi:hypothetical protein